MKLVDFTEIETKCHCKRSCSFCNNTGIYFKTPLFTQMLCWSTGMITLAIIIHLLSEGNTLFIIPLAFLSIFGFYLAYQYDKEKKGGKHK